MSRDELIDAVVSEIERKWPLTEAQRAEGEDHGFDGTFEQYAWLRQHFGVTEEEDNRWLDLLTDEAGDDIEDVEPDVLEEIHEFLDDDAAVRAFLQSLLTKYRSNTAVYGGD